MKISNHGDSVVYVSPTAPIERTGDKGSRSSGGSGGSGGPGPQNTTRSRIKGRPANAPCFSSIKSLLIFFGPVLLPKAIAWYRSVAAAPRRQGLTIQPVPRQVQRLLWLLAAATLLCLVQTLPIFAPENLFVLTGSRLQAPTDVLFNRLASVRAGSSSGLGTVPVASTASLLTPRDERLRARFVSLENRLLYLQFGPDTLADCAWCGGTGATNAGNDGGAAYLYYALPTIVLPHLANLALVALVTSTPVLATGTSSAAGNLGPRWRVPWTIASLVLGAVDLWLVSSYDRFANARATRLSEVDFFFWRARAYRLLGLAALDSSLALVLYLSSTNRMFALPVTPAERVQAISGGLASVRARLSAAEVVRNTAARDDHLLRRSLAYWRHEVALTAEVMEEREVRESLADALANGRVNVAALEQDAETYVNGFLEAAARQYSQQHGGAKQGAAADTDSSSDGDSKPPTDDGRTSTERRRTPSGEDETQDTATAR